MNRKKALLLIAALQTAVLAMLMVLFLSHTIKLNTYIITVIVEGIVFIAITFLIIRKFPPM